MLLPRRQPREPNGKQIKLLEKVAAKTNGEKLTQDERGAIRIKQQWDQYQEAVELIQHFPRWMYLEAVGSSHWQQTKQTAARLGLELKEETNLFEYIRQVHKWLSDNREAGNVRKDPRPLNALEEEKLEYEKLKRKEKEFRMAQESDEWIPRGEVRTGLSVLSNKLRQLGDRLARIPTESEAHEMLQETLDDIDRTIRERFDAA